MKIRKSLLIALSCLMLSPISYSESKDEMKKGAQEDQRIFVEMPKMMQEHQLANMRDHLNAINEILMYMANDDLDKAGDIAENRLGMSSMPTHQAKRMGKLMPKEMKAIGFSMHKAASRFALRAKEGKVAPALKALQEVTAACVACHATYRTH